MKKILRIFRGIKVSQVGTREIRDPPLKTMDMDAKTEPIPNQKRKEEEGYV